MGGGREGGYTPSLLWEELQSHSKRHAERERWGIGIIHSIYHIYYFKNVFCIYLFIHSINIYWAQIMCWKQRIQKCKERRPLSSWNLHFHEKDKQQTGEQTDKTVGYCYKYCEGNKEHSDKEWQGDGRGRGGWSWKSSQGSTPSPMYVPGSHSISWQ